jgi:hypothetical protein
MLDHSSYHHYNVLKDSLMKKGEMLAAMQITFEPDNKGIESIKDLVRLELKGSLVTTMD